MLRLPLALAVAAAVLLGGASGPVARAGEPLTITPVLTGLSWPVSLAFAPDGRAFVAERFTGAIRVVESGALAPGPWATLPVRTAGEQGLLGIAVDPRWAQGEPWVYAYHTYDAAGGATNRIVRILDSGGQGTTLEVLLDGIPANTFHNGGIVEFGPDGMLYATTGDALNGANAQDLLTVAGKVLRMNPDGTVPPDNPFAIEPVANPYVYTYGHRNVFGIAFRPVTGQPFITENGPQDSDEVNALVAGGNYGWPAVRGVAGDPRFRDPIVVFPQSVAPTEAAFFTGSGIANLSGDLVFGDWLRGALNRVRFVAPDSTRVAFTDVIAPSPDGANGILDVEDGPDGNLYFTTPSSVFRVNGTATSVGLPAPALWALAAAVGFAALVAVVVALVVRRIRK